MPPRRKNKQSEISRLKPTVFNFTIGCNSLRFDRSQTKFRDSAFYGLVPVRFLSYAAVCLYLRLFFKPEAAEKAGAWLWKKARSLLLPFYIWNLIYGILITVLLDQGIVSFGYRLSFYTYFIKPWLNNPGAGFNLAAWFVPALFLVMLIYIFLRKLKSFFTSFNEYLFLALLLAIGLLSVYSAAKGFRNSDGSRMLVRCGFLLPFYQIGYLYRSRWESKDRLGHFPYFLIIFTVQFVLFKCFGSVHYSAWNAKFPQGIPWLPFAASITGIFFG